jgi:hypothetical protein
VVSLSLSRKGKPLVRGADGVAGRGGWKKRRPSCNEADRSWDITPRESGLTSIGSLITGEFGEPPSRGNANDGQARTGWCALSRDERGVAASAYREGVTRFPRRTASPREGRLRGLSRVKGDFQARFLGGGAAVTPPCYPAQPTRLACEEAVVPCPPDFYRMKERSLSRRAA